MNKIGIIEAIVGIASELDRGDININEAKDVTIALVEQEFITQNWIDCKDKLPEIGSEYIVSVDCAVFTLAYSCYSKTWVGDDGDVFMGVTHWMPLPEPPQ